MVEGKVVEVVHLLTRNKIGDNSRLRSRGCEEEGCGRGAGKSNDDVGSRRAGERRVLGMCSVYTVRKLYARGSMVVLPSQRENCALPGRIADV